MSTIEREYRKFRAEGYPAHRAIEDARTVVRFAKAEDEGKVRIEWKVDDESYDDSYLDTWDDVSERKVAHYRKELRALIEREGVWGLVSEYKDTSGEWQHADSVWGMVGMDDGGYRPQIMQAALDALEVENANEAHSLGGRATFAGVSP